MPNTQPGKGSDAPRAVVVYVVEADESVRSGLERLLRAARLEPRPYESAERFLEEVSGGRCSCLLLDMTLPGMTGRELQTELRARGLSLPVIAVSVRDDEQIRRSARELGAQLFLSKPVDGQALLDAIEWVTGSGHVGRAEGKGEE